MNICIAGGSGFIGKNLRAFWENKGHQITLISRSDFETNEVYKKIANKELLVNLIGEPIIGRWTKAKKMAIYNSRINTTKMLVDAVNTTENQLKSFINISAVGLYDDSHIHDENSTHYATNYLTQVICDWEAQIKNIQDMDIRKIILRLGIVLGKDGGLFRQLLLPLHYKIAFSIRNFKGLPFIHMKDLLSIFDFVLNTPAVKGIINGVSPVQVDWFNFLLCLNGKIKPWIKINIGLDFIRLVLGESAILITGGQKVIPAKLINAGFTFNFPDIESAIDDLMVFNKHYIESE
jgi:hypothetical protein